MSTATLTDPKALTDEELATALAVLTAEVSRRKPADAPLALGDRVRISDITPKYIIGRTATVQKINKTTLDVKLDDTSRISPRYISPDGTIRVPRPCLTRI